jgi:hypothetical protein
VHHLAFVPYLQVIEKKLAAKVLMEEVAAANSEQIRRKELIKVGVCICT